jgi:signal transduction histidine kinase
MRRRITAAIVGVTSFILLAVGIPLAVAVQHAQVRSEVVEIQALTAQALTEIKTPIDVAQLARLGNEPDAPQGFGVYDGSGARIFGNGPARGDKVVAKALAGVTTTTTDGMIAVATPITDQRETVVGVLRLAESLNDANAQTQRVWLIMVATGLLAIGISWLIAAQLSRRLTDPLVELVDAATEAEVGGVLSTAAPTGIAEIDLLRDALAVNSAKVNDALLRERQFSADVSHQLRTPLAGLRLRLESASTDDNAAAIADLERLEETLDHLLEFARDATPIASACVPAAVVADSVARWNVQAAHIDRSVSCTSTTDAAASVSAIALGQVVDVLIDNALSHGSGPVRVSVRAMTGGLAIDVEDEGALPSTVSEAALFTRHHGTNNGIGLALARSITEAEGGRLIVASRAPTRFSLILLQADNPSFAS